MTLGRFSMARWFPGESIGRIHGEARRIGGRVVMPMYHPAAALHRGDLRPVIIADFAKLPGLVAAASGEAPPATEAPEAAPVASRSATPSSAPSRTRTPSRPALASIPEAEGATEQTSLL